MLVPMNNKPKLLIVDDVSENLHAMTNILREKYAVVVTTNGEKALELASREPQPVLILLDIKMPGMDGYDVLKRLKANPDTIDIPVIFISALNEAADEAKGLKLGAADYISKPINPELLHLRISTQLELLRFRKKIVQAHLYKPLFNILVVDDIPENIHELVAILDAEFNVMVANNGQKAIEIALSTNPPDLILMDVMMPELDGFETCRRLKDNPQSRDIPLLFITVLEGSDDEERGLTLGAEDFIHKPFVPSVVLARIRNHLRLGHATQQLKLRNHDLELKVSERTREIIRQSEEIISQKQTLIAAQDATIMSFRMLAGTRDNETGAHIARTQNYVRTLAEHLCKHPRFKNFLDDEIITLLYKSAPLHDIGKVGIPDAVLHKPDKLNAEEWAIMKRHCEMGRDAIVSSRELNFLHYAREIAFTHHERWDGTGYPQGLAGETIPMSGRLMAIADVYDALISKRVYKPAFSHEQALSMMASERGKHFDPDMLDAMLEIADKFKAIAQRFQCEE